MEFMGFSCAKFVNKSAALLLLAAWTPAAHAQSEQQAQEAAPAATPPPEQRPQEVPPQSQPVTVVPQGVAQQGNSQTIRLTFKDALDLAHKNATQFTAAVTGVEGANITRKPANALPAAPRMKDQVPATTTTR